MTNVLQTSDVTFVEIHVEKASISLDLDNYSTIATLITELEELITTRFEAEGKTIPDFITNPRKLSRLEFKGKELNEQSILFELQIPDWSHLHMVEATPDEKFTPIVEDLATNIERNLCTGSEWTPQTAGRVLSVLALITHVCIALMIGFLFSYHHPLQWVPLLILITAEVLAIIVIEARSLDVDISTHVTALLYAFVTGLIAIPEDISLYSFFCATMLTLIISAIWYSRTRQYPQLHAFVIIIMLTAAVLLIISAVLHQPPYVIGTIMLCLATFLLLRGKAVLTWAGLATAYITPPDVSTTIEKSSEDAESMISQKSKVLLAARYSIALHLACLFLYTCGAFLITVWCPKDKIYWAFALCLLVSLQTFWRGTGHYNSTIHAILLISSYSSLFATATGTYAGNFPFIAEITAGILIISLSVATWIVRTGKAIRSPQTRRLFDAIEYLTFLPTIVVALEIVGIFTKVVHR